VSRQLNLRVSDDFVKKLERVARRTGKPMAALLESVGTPALDEAEADARFEAEALAAWEEYQLTGKSVGAEEIDALFADARRRARAPARRRSR
jgi:predicted transcriptional regulator